MKIRWLIGRILSDAQQRFINFDVTRHTCKVDEASFYSLLGGMKLHNFIQLVRNENMKIYRRIGTWVLIAMMLLCNGFICWAQAAGGISSFLNSLHSILALITCACVFIGSRAIVMEFTMGTIKLLLIRPWTRSQVLLSKYVAVMIFFLLNVALTFIVYGCSVLKRGQQFFLLKESSITWGSIAYSIIIAIIVISFSFFISTVFRATIFAVGFSSFIMIVPDIFNFFFNPSEHWWAKYVLLSHMYGQKYGAPFSSLMNHTLYAQTGMTFSFSLFMLVLYNFLFMALAFIGFHKRDITSTNE